MQYFIHSIDALLSLTLQDIFHSKSIDDLKLSFRSRVSQGNQSVQLKIEEALADLDVIKCTWKGWYNVPNMILHLPAEVLSIVLQICTCSVQLKHRRHEQIKWTIVVQVVSARYHVRYVA